MCTMYVEENIIMDPLSDNYAEYIIKTFKSYYVEIIKVKKSVICRSYTSSDFLLPKMYMNSWTSRSYCEQIP